MKNLFGLLKAVSLMLMALLVFSCDNDDNANTDFPQTKNIVQTAQGASSLNLLVKALLKADESTANDLVATLSGEGPFTVFAPTNEAFDALLASLDDYNSLEDFDTDEKRALLAEILTYHVIAGAAADSSILTNGQELTTVQGEKLTVGISTDIFIDDATDTDAKVISADIVANNGIVHIIDKVLVPQSVLDALNEEEPTNNLVEIVVATESLSILEAAVIKADLATTLSGDGPFTVFAPTDDAFVALLNVLGDDYNSLDDFDTEAEIMLLKDILLYHVLPVQVLAADLAPGMVATAYVNNSIEVIASGDTFVIGDASDTDANITATDILATNGVAHTIDKVLLPQSAIDFVASLNAKTIVELAVATDDLSVLVAALQQADAGLVETLSAEGTYTVFAPTNAAFTALLAALGDEYNSLQDFDTQEEKDLLRDILLYHVLPIEVFSSALSEGSVATAFTGNSIDVIASGETFVIGDASDTDANITAVDVDASNGVVHLIDKVLLPQSAIDFVASLNAKTIVELAVATDDLSVLVAALQQADADLVETLSAEGTYTVFAPTNAAFTALLAALGDNYNSLSDFDTQEEKDLLRDILLYHVLPVEVFSHALAEGSVETAFTGNSIEVIATGDTFVIGDASDTDANITAVDIDASNGVVHVIDKVLLPQSALDFVASL
ncbi:fasciclin domain-containing protein [Arenibacter sp. 6A1]|uniref:fasciclin domain-containing protein n=1 Tax=Arenibacter sp. 6A1 TaxID=2720391 RepID=UPI00144611C1|nr:fasciclin domain-containing protein [Arenibacter sp. 6A1]NKI26339.1 fasciclin domain-containing protein [Arenibacter sp. 6A1]